MDIQAQLCSDNFGVSLCGSQNWMESFYQFNESCFNLPQKQNLQHKTHDLLFQSNGLVSNRKNGQDLGFSLLELAQIEKQKEEVDRFICLQNETLRLALRYHTKQQISLLLRKCEAKTEFLLKQKDEEISKALSRTGELEDFVKRIEIENQNWQRLATENEAMVSYLNKKMQQFKENACSTHWVEDAESCCEEGKGETVEDWGEENEQKMRTMLMCKCCSSRKSCVVFLPCRHLCSCESCQAFLNSCPVCGVVKKATMEVFI